jgi:hypothetical protein
LITAAITHQLLDGPVRLEVRAVASGKRAFGSLSAYTTIYDTISRALSFVGGHDAAIVATNLDQAACRL